MDTIYEIYEGDDLIYSGTQKQIKREFGLKSSIGTYATRNHKLLGIYDVKIQKPKPKPKISKHEKDIAYLLKGLKAYGNVYFNQNPKDYLEELKEYGYDCVVTVFVNDGVKDYILEAK